MKLFARKRGRIYLVRRYIGLGLVWLACKIMTRHTVIVTEKLTVGEAYTDAVARRMTMGDAPYRAPEAQ